MVFDIVIENHRESIHIRGFQVTHQCLGMLRINNLSTSYPHTTFYLLSFTPRHLNMSSHRSSKLTESLFTHLLSQECFFNTIDNEKGKQSNRTCQFQRSWFKPNSFHGMTKGGRVWVADIMSKSWPYWILISYWFYGFLCKHVKSSHLV